MADFRPVRLDDFCNFFSVSIFDLYLPCIFCKFICDLQDLAAFHVKKLSIVWRNGKAFVCCRKCVQLSAKYEFDNYSVCVVKACSLEGLLHKSLQSITIRCVSCYQLLDLTEKIDCCARQDDFALVRGSWRGPCRNCHTK
uniref:Protein E6 n=1 Tax=Human papillomavirus TaxID=10566 RepID=A0A385PR32_9PAPI|nr:MAG: E6 protein [Human papillomavirus]